MSTNLNSFLFLNRRVAFQEFQLFAPKRFLIIYNFKLSLIIHKKMLLRISHSLCVNKMAGLKYTRDYNLTMTPLKKMFFIKIVTFSFEK